MSWNTDALEATRFEMDTRGVGTLTLNRPEVRNAMNPQMMSELISIMRSPLEGCRVIVVRGEGPMFCSGADLKWMRTVAEDGATGADSFKLLDLFRAVEQSPVPIVARVHGGALAGATGFIAACDVVVSEESARFAFTEVRIGLIPAVISPYVIRKTGYSFARAFFMTGDAFDGRRAAEAGLVHFAVPAGDLDARVEEVVGSLLLGAPGAQIAARNLLNAVGTRSPEEVADLTVNAIAERRASEEGQEGMLAFLEKRKPSWAEDSSS